MKIVAVSDLHGQLPNIPACDLLLIAGDVCPVWNHRLDFQGRWLRSRFSEWLRSLPVRKIVGVWGNHDLVAQRLPSEVNDLPWTLLTDAACQWQGFTIYGLPWQRTFGKDWAFNLDTADLDQKYAAIPPCDIIVSHGPAYGYGDLVNDKERVGSPAFLAAIDSSRPRLVVTGHIHCDPGVWERGVTTIANVALLDDDYRRSREPLEVDL